MTFSTPSTADHAAGFPGRWPPLPPAEESGPRTERRQL